MSTDSPPPPDVDSLGDPPDRVRWDFMGRMVEGEVLERVIDAAYDGDSIFYRVDIGSRATHRVDRRCVEVVE